MLNMFYDIQPVNLAYDFTIPSCITASLYADDCPRLLEFGY